MQSREIMLTPSSVDNGRIYFPVADRDFFPADSFSDRHNDGHKGVPVLIEAGGSTYKTAIREYSGLRLSPQTYFARFLKAVEAVAGDSLFVERTADREYRMTFRPARKP